MNLTFGAEKIDLSNLSEIGKSAPDLLVWAAPVMFFFVILEYFVSRRLGHHNVYNKRETIGSILVGLGNVAIGVALKALLLGVFVVFYNLVPWRMEFTWWAFLPCYIIFDLCSYWAHNVSHRMRFLWATHVAHHSGEHYNFTVSFRLSWVQWFKIIFFLPVAILGFHPIIIFFVNQVAILFQFWQHTEYIGKLHPWVEYIIATPSNHRVHHGSQAKYINKNYAATFIIWDRIFGTYQKEEEPAKYGITKNLAHAHKHDPIHINFHEYVDMLRDVRQADNWKEGFFYVFGDPEDIYQYKLRKAEQQEARARVIEMEPSGSGTDTPSDGGYKNAVGE